VRYDPADGTAVRFRHDPRRADSLSADDLTCLLISPALPGRLWVASAGGDLDDLDLGSGRVIRHPAAPLRPGRIHALCGDGEGRLWIGAAAGLFRFLPQDGRLQGCPMPAPGAGRKAHRCQGHPLRSRLPACCGSGAMAPGSSAPAGRGSLAARHLNGNGRQPRGRHRHQRHRLLSREPQNLILGGESSLTAFEPLTGRTSPDPVHRLQGRRSTRPPRPSTATRRGFTVRHPRPRPYKWSPLLKNSALLLALPSPTLANWITSMQELADGGIWSRLHGGGAWF
jgi:hypothetical protein